MMLVKRRQEFPRFEGAEDPGDIRLHPEIGRIVDQEVVFVLHHVLAFDELDARGGQRKSVARPGIELVVQQVVDFRGKDHARSHGVIGFKLVVEFSPRLR